MADVFPDGLLVGELGLTLTGEGYGASADPVRWHGSIPFGMPELLPERSVVPRYQYEIKSWEAPDPEPSVWTPFVGGEEGKIKNDIKLASALSFKFNDGMTTEVTTSFMRMRWRLAWAMPETPDAWHFVHLRYKAASWNASTETPDPEVPYELGDLHDFWWKGEVPEDYDAEDPATWPGTEWVETALPTTSEATTPPPAESRFSENYVLIAWLWPKPAWLEKHPTKHENDAQYPGFIPGGAGPSAKYLKPGWMTPGGMRWLRRPE